MTTLSTTPPRRIAASVLLLCAVAAPSAADAAPRISGLAVPPELAGKLSRSSGSAPIICTATGPVTATFTSNEAGTLTAVITDGALLRLNNTGIGRVAIRRGANTVDLAQLRTVFNGPSFLYNGPLRFSRQVAGETAGPVAQTWRVSLIATDRFGRPGTVANRSVRVTCVF